MTGGTIRIKNTVVITIILLAGIFGSRLAGASSVSSMIEIIEVKNLGISAGDSDKSIIQIKWLAETKSGMTLSSFDIFLEVTYADGACEKLRATANGSARSARFELQTVHTAAGRATAALKSFKASVTANSAETTTKAGSL